MVIKNTYLKLLLPLILVIISIVSIIFLVQKTVVYSAEYFKGKSEFSSLQNKIKTFYGQESTFEASQQKISIISKAFLTNDDFVVFIKQIEELASKNNIVVNIKSVVSPTKEKPYFVFQLGIVGNFPNFLKFLFSIENNPFSEYRLIDIQKIGIKKVITGAAQAGASPVSSIEADIEVRVYGKP